MAGQVGMMGCGVSRCGRAWDVGKEGSERVQAGTACRHDKKRLASGSAGRNDGLRLGSVWYGPSVGWELEGGGQDRRHDMKQESNGQTSRIEWRRRQQPNASAAIATFSPNWSR